MHDLFVRHPNGLLRLLAVLLPLAVLAQAGGQAVRLALRYERSAVLGGQLWRLLTAHLVHLGWMHLALNAAALLLVALLFGTRWRTRQWAALALAAALAVSLGLLLANPRLGWYVGLSGVAHGLFAAGALGHWRAQRAAAALGLAALAAKLAWEQLGGGATAPPALIGGATVVDSHLYGALGGLAAAWALQTRRPARSGSSTTPTTARDRCDRS